MLPPSVLTSPFSSNTAKWLSWPPAEHIPRDSQHIAILFPEHNNYQPEQRTCAHSRKKGCNWAFGMQETHRWQPRAGQTAR